MAGGADHGRDRSAGQSKGDLFGATRIVDDVRRASRPAVGAGTANHGQAEGQRFGGFWSPWPGGPGVPTSITATWVVSVLKVRTLECRVSVSVSAAGRDAGHSRDPQTSRDGQHAECSCSFAVPDARFVTPTEQRPPEVRTAQ